jgi:hypothetical protein
MLVEMKEHLASEPQDRRDRAKHLRKIATTLTKAVAVLDEADNVSLARMQAFATGLYPKTSVSAHELGIAIRSFSKGADAAASEFDGKGPERGPDHAYTMHIARTALTILDAHGIPARELKNKALEATIAIAFQVLSIDQGSPAEYAKKAVGQATL